MKTGLFIFLVFSSSFTWGQAQSKWTYAGTYTHSFFMYEYFLTLKADSTFEVVEKTDLGSEKTIGTWMTMGRKIVLTSAMRTSSDRSSGRNKTTTMHVSQTTITIGEGNVLILPAGTKKYYLQKVTPTKK